MTKKLAAATLILFISTVCLGQTKDSMTPKQWRLSAGYQQVSMLDKNASPLIYHANTGRVDALLQQTNANRLWNIGASVSIGSNQSKRFGQREAVAFDHYTIDGSRDSSIYVLNPGLSFLSTGLSYAHYWKLPYQPLDIYIGGKVQDNFSYSAIGADTWFFNQLSVAPSCKVSLMKAGKSTFTTEIGIPLFSYVLRQPYALDPSLPENSYFKAYLQTGSDVATVNKFQQVNFSLGYDRQISKQRAIGACYKFTWMNYSDVPDRPLKAYSNSILLSYSF